MKALQANARTHSNNQAEQVAILKADTGTGNDNRQGNSNLYRQLNHIGLS